MVELPRAAARAYRAVLRKCAPAGARPADCTVHCRAGPSGQELCCRLEDVVLKHSTPVKSPVGHVAFPLSLLAQFEGRNGGVVKLEALGPGKARASWKEAGSERALEFASPGDAMPEVPDCKAHCPGPGFLQALAEAARTSGAEPARMALRCVMLSGGGEIVATDGRQLLVQKGFQFPWQGDVLVPALPAFWLKEMALEKPMLGKSGPTVVLSCGPWLLALQEQDGRHFPDVSRVVAFECDCKLRLHPGDAALLRERLPGLPGGDERPAPVVLELGPSPRVRAGAGEVRLEKSTCWGPALSVQTDRCFLLRALQLGFLEVETAPRKPLRCKDEKRTYMWMPLDTGPPAPAKAPPRKEGDMPQPNRRGAESNDAAEPPDALGEAEALKRQLQEALARTARLVAALRKERREGKAVKNAVESLRRLGGLGE